MNVITFPVITTNQTENALELLKKLDDPEQERQMKEAGWNTNEMRRECEKAIKP